MSKKVSRRDFIKLAGVSGGAVAALTGCGTAARYVTREPYTSMPEYTYSGKSTYFATTCRECAAACGLIVRTHQGRAINVAGNKRHPVNLGKTCSRGQATLQGLYNPDRVQQPVVQSRKQHALSGQTITWDEAITIVADNLQDPKATAFLLGMSPDHLFDLLSELAQTTGASQPVRYGALSTFESQATLRAASQKVFNQEGLPFFDIQNADVVLSFGANFLETWLSPMAYSRGYKGLRQSKPGRRGYLIQFEPRMSQTAVTADEWISVRPGTEGLVALAIGRLAAEHKGGAIPQAYLTVDVAQAAEQSGVELHELERLGRIFGNAEQALAIPGGAALGHSNGLQTAQAVLTLNALAGNIGQDGGVFLQPPVSGMTNQTSASFDQMTALVQKMKAGEIKTLFVHGVNPVYELPKTLGFADALANVATVISFASFPDETALMADYIFPDHTALESWGYQRITVGADRATLSGLQPVVVPFHDTRATVDIFLAASDALAYADEVAFIESKLQLLVTADGFYAAPEVKTFMSKFQQFGGWWQKETNLQALNTTALNKASQVDKPEFHGEGKFFLHVFPSPILGDGAGANRPWLQETPDPNTTVMWNTWVEVNPETGYKLGLHNDDVVKIISDFGEIEASVYLYPAIRPDTIAIPFGQGHTALGRYAQGRGANPADLLGLLTNEAGDLAFSVTKVEIQKTGRQRPLARMESQLGVYGDGQH